MKINKCVLRRFFMFVLSASSFMMISCNENNPCSNIKNGLYCKKIEPIAKIAKEDFGNNYSEQYKELLRKIKELYDVYGSDDGQDEENDPSEEFIKRVRDIVEKNKGIYEETYKQIDKYTRKIPPMPWAYGCTIKGLVMYILHNPIIKCAVQYFDNYKRTKDETGKTFDEMVTEPERYIDEWHNCLVTFIRLLKLTYEELEGDNNDVKVHGKLWNQIQGLEYLLHFLCFGYRRGYFDVKNSICFLKVFLNILGVFDFSKKPKVFGVNKKELKYYVYSCAENGFIEEPFWTPQMVSKEYLDSICCEDPYAFSENISDIISKSNRTNWMIQDTQGNHVFHFYICKNEDETVYYIHDGWYEYQDFLKNILPDLQKEKVKLIYYSIPFTFIIIHCIKEREITILDQNLILTEVMTDFWDSLIPLLSTDLDRVAECSNKLYTNFEYSNENEKKALFRYFLDYLDSLISDIVEKYQHFKLDKNQGEFEFNDALKDLLSFTVGGNVLSKDEKNIDIVKINDYYYKAKEKIGNQYPDKKNNRERVENKKKVQPMLDLLSKTINKMRWFLRSNEVVDLIVGYHPIRYKTELQVAFIENIEKIPVKINEMFNKWVKKYFSHIARGGKDFAFKKLVHGKNGANIMYDGKKYNQDDVLKVDWTKTGLEEKDLPIFREKFAEYEFFKSTQFSDIVK